ncbi:MAG: adenosylmethionine decarboxylase [Litoreibacter sp.]|uniref:adenosylmethionine decarboxylase n=1 Tax=Litoreibacter sp. TaxID=1969459 RepID=UPI00329A6788
MNISAPFPVLGKHLIADFYGASHLIDHKPAEAVFAQAAKEGGATLLGIEMHDFGVGAGFTGVAILAESHISIHTWPEHQHAAIDIFMCGDADPRLSLAVLQRYFQPAQSEVQLIERGTRASAPVGAL